MGSGWIRRRLILMLGGGFIRARRWRMRRLRGVGGRRLLRGFSVEVTRRREIGGDMLGITRGIVSCSSGVNICVHCQLTDFNGKRVFHQVWVQLCIHGRELLSGIQARVAFRWSLERDRTPEQLMLPWRAKHVHVHTYIHVRMHAVCKKEG